MNVSASQVVCFALEVMCDWTKAKELKHQMVRSSDSAPCLMWHPPPMHFLKCNVDAAVFEDISSVGICCCFPRC